MGLVTTRERIKWLLEGDSWSSFFLKDDSKLRLDKIHFVDDDVELLPEENHADTVLNALAGPICDVALYLRALDNSARFFVQNFPPIKWVVANNTKFAFENFLTEIQWDLFGLPILVLHVQSPWSLRHSRR